MTNHLVEHATQVASRTEAMERAVDRAWSGMALPWDPILLSGLPPPGTATTARAAGPGGNHPQTGDDIPRRLDQDRAQAAGGPGKGPADSHIGGHQ